MVSQLTEAKNIRIKFSKRGMAKFISHLDLTRTMKYILARANLKLEYSNGFNPRPKMNFSLPLSVGTESICEYLDIKLLSDISYEEIKNRLNNNLPNDIRVADVYEYTDSFKLIAYSKYIITLHTGKSLQNEENVKKIENLLSNPLLINKRTKSGKDKKIDISEFINNFDISIENDNIIIEVMLCSSNENFVNPEYIIKAFDNYLGITFKNPLCEYYNILRESIYTANARTEFH